jgi:hypothetical protein
VRICGEDGMIYGHTESEWNEAKKQARDAMIKRAQKRGMITYTELTNAISAIRFQPDGFDLANLLDEISTEENAAGRGMLTVIVVHKKGDMEPGAGFYKLARDLGKSFTEQVSFWVKELHGVHDTWSNNPNKVI